MSKVEQAVITGGLYNIEPSEAFQGIEPGIVEVLEITIGSESKYKSEIEEYATSASEEENINKNTLWVAYMYNTGDDEEVYVLPIEVFKEHTTAYILD